MRRRQAKLVLMGRGALVRGEEAEIAFARVRDFHSRGMAASALARATGASTSTISQMITGVRSDGYVIKQIRRTTYDRIMAATFTPPGMTPNGRMGGAETPVEGTRRRLQALARAGWSLAAVAAESGLQKAHLHRIVQGSRRYVHASTAQIIAATYDRVIAKDPADYGLTRYQIGRAKGAAQRNGYPPAMCWDEDTIDDPRAIAQWTGHCGTMEGYRIHQREGIKTCKACRVVCNKQRREERHAVSDNRAER
jgi:transcriptional regulator with XRE-family HTH domain